MTTKIRPVKASTNFDILTRRACRVASSFSIRVRKKTVTSATLERVIATPVIMTSANMIPAPGTPRDIAKVMTNSVKGQGIRPVHEADGNTFSFAVDMRRPEADAPQHPGSDEAEQTPAHVLEQRRRPGASKHKRYERQREQGYDHGHRHMRGGQCQGDHQPAPHAGRRTGQVGGKHSLAVAGRHRMHSAEYDPHRQEGQEVRPATAIRDGFDMLG